MTTTPTTTPPTREALITAKRAALTKQRADRLDPLDFPRVWTMRQCDVYSSETVRIDREIAAFERAVSAAQPNSDLDLDTQWLAHLTAWRDVLCTELLTIKSPIRDRDIKAQADALTWAIRLIDFGFRIAPLGITTLAPTRIGELMVGAGYTVEGDGLRGAHGWRGSLPEVEHRIATLTQQRTAALAALDAVLLDDAARATVEAEAQDYRDALNRLHLKGSPDGQGYVVCDEQGDVRDLTTLTPAERTAFERVDAAYRHERAARLDRALGRG
ncbi:MAG: hypothetical protein ABL986_23445 [Vicinamibacterales bacterium]